MGIDAISSLEQIIFEKKKINNLYTVYFITVHGFFVFVPVSLFIIIIIFFFFFFFFFFFVRRFLEWDFFFLISPFPDHCVT